MKVVVLIPAYQEEATIAKVILGAEDFCEDIIVCDDGSTDATGRIAEALGVEVIRHEWNEGKGWALRSLFLKAIELGANEVVTIDADGQHNPKDIPRLLEGLKDADIVIGKRVGSVPLSRKFGNFAMNPFGKFDTQSGFRAYKGSVLPFLIPSEHDFAVETEIIELAKENNLRISQLPISIDYNVLKPSKSHPWVHGPEIWWTKVMLFALRHPLVFYTMPGTIFLFSAFFFALHDLQYLLSAGLGSFFLGLAGFFLLEVGILVWTLATLTKRGQR